MEKFVSGKNLLFYSCCTSLILALHYKPLWWVTLLGTTIAMSLTFGIISYFQDQLRNFEIKTKRDCVIEKTRLVLLCIYVLFLIVVFGYLATSENAVVSSENRLNEPSFSFITMGISVFFGLLYWINIRSKFKEKWNSIQKLTHK